ncbi:4'-phosphopantetheinyl transferase [Singulisphaera sp. GP187]|uniref:4'-phosphopantetheinyl transferase family protein n=1 Tax=Singulisphaera sp. GP187 TaxID=1882752 RepID=UPI00092B910F|nr:4'-phosphopantetheinyl transferase superfamily protein [Singulisphaera sp. GP187]SIO60273.1 4'-phosphopantetheinyl transferase [Singulisphaera sp. GP187]
MTTASYSFRPGDSVETLGPDDVHVWMASLEQAEHEIAQFRTLLDEPERKRADRYSFEKGRRHFTVARGLLRVLLGRYLRIEPSHVQFSYNAHGKPALADAHEPDLVRFNISHSGEIALFGFARERELGIDLETIRPDFAADAIAARFFAPAELAAIRSLPAEERIQAFFTCWTRKEAYIKAQGKGLALPLDSFEVSLAPGAPAAVLVTHDNRDEAARWSLHELHPGPGYVGALAVAGEGCRVRVRTWPGLSA